MPDTYSFELPKHHKSIIKVIGVGGGGSNAVNHMYNLGIKDVEFVACNTDAQALKNSPVPNKLQIGVNITEGLGAGANPEKGREAALESKDDIREMLSDDTKMLFVTAGMGGGTGTGAAPVIAKTAKELDILTVGIVTMPFAFEGKKKWALAEQGVKELKESCDTVLVIMNDKLKDIYGNLPVREAFAKADNVLTTAAKGIAEIITVPGYVNVDFQDVRTVMLNAGAAVMGSATKEGEGRARKAAEEALLSPLLNNREIHGAKKILLSIMSGEEAELQMDELTEITEYIQEMAGDDAETIFGHGIDPDLGESIRVTVIATGFEHTAEASRTAEEAPGRKVLSLDDEVTQPVRIEDNLHNDLEPVIKKEEKPETVANTEEPLFPEPTPAEEEAAGLREPDNGYFFDNPAGDGEQQTATPELFPDYQGQEEKEQEPRQVQAGIRSVPAAEKYRIKRQQRIQELAGKSTHGLSNEEINEKLDTPAYLRKNVRLDDVPHSSERNISRFSLNDDNQILGNNKYLHDNVD